MLLPVPGTFSFPIQALRLIIFVNDGRGQMSMHAESRWFKFFKFSTYLWHYVFSRVSHWQQCVFPQEYVKSYFILQGLNSYKYKSLSKW